jgi:hypothetical protein
VPVAERKLFTITSGVARFFYFRGEQSQWPPVTEITNFKKTHSYLFNFVLFVSIILNLFSAENSIFSISNIHFAASSTLLPGAAAPLAPGCNSL